jgi:hypothetical protein
MRARQRLRSWSFRGDRHGFRQRARYQILLAKELGYLADADATNWRPMSKR